jgi:hypothetical protein
MTEGKKRQIRRVASLLGHPVKRLIRTHIGMFPLGDLAPGQSRELTAAEVIALGTPSPEIKTLRAQRPTVAGEKKVTPVADNPEKRRSVRVRKAQDSPNKRSSPRDRKPRGKRDRPR